MKKCVWLTLVVSLLFPLVAHAQIPGLIPNPTAIEFDPSPDHNNTLLDGTSIVGDYKVYFFLNADTPVKGAEKFVVSVGKPAIVGGKVTGINLYGGLVPNTAYKAVVVANGPGGESLFSNVSVPFGKAVAVVPSKVPGTPLPK